MNDTECGRRHTAIVCTMYAIRRSHRNVSVRIADFRIFSSSLYVASFAAILCPFRFIQIRLVDIIPFFFLLSLSLRLSRSLSLGISLFSVYEFQYIFRLKRFLARLRYHRYHTNFQRSQSAACVGICLRVYVCVHKEKTEKSTRESRIESNGEEEKKTVCDDKNDFRLMVFAAISLSFAFFLSPLFSIFLRFPHPPLSCLACHSDIWFWLLVFMARSPTLPYYYCQHRKGAEGGGTWKREKEMERGRTGGRKKWRVRIRLEIDKYRILVYYGRQWKRLSLCTLRFSSEEEKRHSGGCVCVCMCAV